MIHAPIGERGGRQRIAAKKGPSEATQWVEVGLQPTGTTVLALGRFRVSPPFPSIVPPGFVWVPPEIRASPNFRATVQAGVVCAAGVSEAWRRCPTVFSMSSRWRGKSASGRRHLGAPATRRLSLVRLRPRRAQLRFSWFQESTQSPSPLDVSSFVSPPIPIESRMLIG